MNKIVSISVAIFLLAIPVLFVTPVGAEDIVVDGSLSDWADLGISPLGVDGDDQWAGYADLLRFWAYLGDTNLFLAIQVDSEYPVDFEPVIFDILLTPENSSSWYEVIWGDSSWHDPYLLSHGEHHGEIQNITAQTGWDGVIEFSVPLSYIDIKTKVMSLEVSSFSSDWLYEIDLMPAAWEEPYAIEFPSPVIQILSPQNEMYAKNSVSLTFIVDQPTSWIGYSLDSQTNITTNGNMTVYDLSDGTHTIKVYANNTYGIMDCSTVHFTVDTIPPNIEIISPGNKTYTSSSVSLNFSVDETTSWISYSLDGQMNQTIPAENGTLSELSDGSHGLKLYAKDTIGNIGASEMVYFSIETPSPPPEPFPTWLVATIGIIAVVGAALLVYFTKVKKTTGKVK